MIEALSLKTVIDLAWQALAVAAVVLTAVALGRRWPARLRAGLLAVALLKFLTPPVVALPTGLLPWVAALWALNGPATIVGAGTATGIAVARPAGDGASMLAVAVALYVLGVLAVAGAALHGARRVRVWRRHAVAAPDALVDRARTLCSHFGLDRTPAILVSHAVSAPLAVGLVRPAILMPAPFLESLRPVEMDAVLAHEIVHHRRKHLVWGWLRLVVCAVWWWHPASWVVSKRLRRAQEEVCDDAVVQAGVIGREPYCDVLMRAARLARPALTASAAFGEPTHPLARRLRRLLDGSAAPAGSPALNAAMIAAATLVLLPGVPRATPIAVGQAADEPRDVVRTLEPQREIVAPGPPSDPPSSPPTASRGQAAVRMDDKVPPPVSRTLIPDELPIVTVVSGVADVLDQAIDRLVSALPSAPAAARDGLRTEAASSDSTDVKGPDAEAVRNAIADRYEQRYYADMLASGAPEHVARDVSRGIARSIRGQGRGVWRSIGRGFGRMFRWW